MRAKLADSIIQASLTPSGGAASRPDYQKMLPGV
jgi:hypothetical protein